MKRIGFIAVFGLLMITQTSFAGGEHGEKPGVQDKKVGLNIGDIAPELKFKDPDGKEVALSSLRGKAVLIDFWASWCRPCRVENPNVVSAYNKFKSQGFEIYGVSLDKNQGAWVNAIKQDALNWVNVSDLGGWNSKGAAIYGVRSIPGNFLLDKDGVIVAKNLRGANLHAEVGKVVAK